MASGLMEREGASPNPSEGPEDMSDRIEQLESSKYSLDQYVQYQAHRIDLLRCEVERLKLRNELFWKTLREVMVLTMVSLGATLLTIMVYMGLI